MLYPKLQHTGTQWNTRRLYGLIACKWHSVQPPSLSGWEFCDLKNHKSSRRNQNRSPEEAVSWQFEGFSRLGVFVGGLCQGYVVDAAARKARWLTMLLLQMSLTHCWAVLGGGVWRCGGMIGRSMWKLIQGQLLLIQLQKSLSTLCLCHSWNFSWTRISQMLWDTHTPSNANLAIELSCALCAGTSDHQRWIISEGQLKRPRKVLAGNQNLVSSSWWRW